MRSFRESISSTVSRVMCRSGRRRPRCSCLSATAMVMRQRGRRARVARSARRRMFPRPSRTRCRAPKTCRPTRSPKELLRPHRLTKSPPQLRRPSARRLMALSSAMLHRRSFRKSGTPTCRCTQSTSREASLSLQARRKRPMPRAIAARIALPGRHLGKPTLRMLRTRQGAATHRRTDWERTKTKPSRKVLSSMRGRWPTTGQLPMGCLGMLRRRKANTVFPSRSPLRSVSPTCRCTWSMSQRSVWRRHWSWRTSRARITSPRWHVGAPALARVTTRQEVTMRSRCPSRRMQTARAISPRRLWLTLHLGR
mmetsp:Transcript_55058/g.159430  ORF Transcript_55058/g.159430 Transcript_55058/m.159430 type:complete len:310 (-) Transcript_55058:1736-2665(-)